MKEYKIWVGAKKRSKDIGVPFSITPFDILIPVVCPLLGIKLVCSNAKTSPNSPSLDRIDSSKGYTKDNIMVISHRANTIKNNATLNELKTIVKNLEAVWPIST